MNERRKSLHMKRLHRYRGWLLWEVLGFAMEFPAYGTTHLNQSLPSNSTGGLLGSPEGGGPVPWSIFLSLLREGITKLPIGWGSLPLNTHHLLSRSLALSVHLSLSFILKWGMFPKPTVAQSTVFLAECPHRKDR